MYAASRSFFLQLRSPGTGSAYETDAGHMIVRALTVRPKYYPTKYLKDAYYEQPKDKQ